MELHFHFHEHSDLTAIVSKLSQILSQQEFIVSHLEDLEAAITENNAVDASAIALIEGIAAQLEANAASETKIREFAAELRSRNAALAAAVAANTPATPEPEPPVEPQPVPEPPTE